MRKIIQWVSGLAVLSLTGLILAAETTTNTPPQSVAAADKESGKQSGKEPGKEKSKEKEPEEKLVESEHSVKISNQDVKYKASAGTILLRDEEDKPTASIF